MKNFEMPLNFTSLSSAVKALFGNNAKIIKKERIFGGDINKSYILVLNSGESIFMKTNSIENACFFHAESYGLFTIASTETIGCPRILCTGTDQMENFSFLLLEYIENSSARLDYWETFASELAAMHKADTVIFTGDKKFGFLEDNFIGRRAQQNTLSQSWIKFFRDFRLVPQFKDADLYFTDSDREYITRLLDHLESFLVEPEKPSLLHGDLWSGNVICGAEGKAVLIDPAVYIGNAEADLAMTELFGDFPPEFYGAYRSCFTLQPGYEQRRDLYNLYHLLNHLNMFGRSYLGAVKSIVQYYAG